jgi:hypothetical protein
MATLWNYLFRVEQGLEEKPVTGIAAARKIINSTAFPFDEQDWVVVREDEKEQEGVLQFIPTVPKLIVPEVSPPMTPALHGSININLHPLKDCEPVETEEKVHNPIEDPKPIIETPTSSHVAQLLAERDSRVNPQTINMDSKRKSKSKGKKKSHTRRQ